MARIQTKHTVKVGKRNFRLRTNEAFFPVLNEEEIKASGPQMRNLAYGSYVLLVDKILAGDSQGFPTRLTVKDLPYYDSKFRGLGNRKPFPFLSLDETYLDWKVDRDLDPRPLIATGFYLKNIWVTEEDSATGTLWSIYVPDIVHKPSGVRLQALVGWLEKGTPSMPARPHWGPVAVMVRRKWERLPKGIRTEALREALRRLR